MYLGQIFIDYQPEGTSNLKLSNSKSAVPTLGKFDLLLSTKKDHPPNQLTTIPEYQFVDTCYQGLLLSRLVQESSLNLEPLSSFLLQYIP